VPLVPILGMAVCFAMMAGLPGDTWLRLVIWLAIGLLIYFLYSRHHSLIQRTGVQARELEPARPTYTEPKSRVRSDSAGGGSGGSRRGSRRGRRGGRGRGR
jgi:hypothetical protein